MNAISKDRMAPNEKEERKRTFYGGLASMIMFLGNIAEIDDETIATKALEMLKDKVRDYWRGELERHAIKNSKTK